MDYTSSTHLHNIEYIRNKFSDNIFYVITTSLSIPLLHQSIHIGVNDLFLFPFSESDKTYINQSLNNKRDQQPLRNRVDTNLGLSLTKENPVWSLLNVIERDFSIGPALQDLSNDIHLSPSRLCHMFKDLCGINYSNYLTCRKLEEAERLLSLGNTSITTIAYQLGFSNPSHFCRSFKEHYNVTPNSYAQGNRDLLQSKVYKRYQRLRTELLPNMIANEKNNQASVQRKRSVV